MSFVKCKTCGNTIEEGLGLFRSYICNECLDKIANTNMKDTIYYEYYRAIIKRMWLDYIAEMEF
ncbi:hypothetical protein GOQ29_09795 [Clostridium sp. D2Q-14]|uniref:sigma factor G inhibitor Gin n=1 Tax=Anaeromonas gelatinilytica TaxID=2683194 RepID=UPI00193B87B8|nr:hypothetical protein [Anaeromonas gelatinilytica]